MSSAPEYRLARGFGALGSVANIYFIYDLIPRATLHFGE